MVRRHGLTPGSRILETGVQEGDFALREAFRLPALVNTQMAALLGVQSGTAHIPYRRISYLQGDFPVEVATDIFFGDIFILEDN